MYPQMLMSSEVLYVLLLFLLFVLPRVLQRYRIPSAVTSLALGALCGMVLSLFAHDQTVELLSTFGIVSLFLFAGLDVSVQELRQELPVLVEHIVIRVVTLAVATWVVSEVLDLATRGAALVALALFTPSTGFILDSLHTVGASDHERFWIRSKAIATELVALAVLFVVLQSATVIRLSVSVMVLVAMILVVPLVFKVFAKAVVPYAPKSEFAFLMMIAVVCAMVTLRLGVYYLAGAFVVGMVAQRFRERLPAMASEKMLHAVEAFASLFVPFYFFHAGLQLRQDDFGFASLLTGIAFLATAIPLRIALVALHRRFRLKEPFRQTLRVGVPMLPTLVFTLVIAGILRDRFEAPLHIFGGLIVYTLVNTIIPGVVFRTPPIELETLTLLSQGGAGDKSTSRSGNP